MYSFKSRIRFTEVDSDLNLTLPGILSYFQDCSVFHSESIDNGVKIMMERGVAWFLSSWLVEVRQYPKLGDEIIVSTWAHGYRGFFGYRNFKLEYPDGTLLARANSNWVYTNIHTGHPERIPQDVIDAYNCEPALDMENAPRKIPVPDNGAEKEAFRVRHADIDSNQHVNNERYVIFAQEYLPKDFSVGRLRVEYKNAAVYGDTIYPVVTDTPEGSTVTLNDHDGTPYAVVEFSR